MVLSYIETNFAPQTEPEPSLSLMHIVPLLLPV